MRKSIFSVIVVCLMAVILPITCFAHSGRTDSQGGHKDNKNKSGLGSYHYHCGGYPAHLHSGGVCPYKKTTTNTVKKSVYASSITVNDVPTTMDAGSETKLEASVYPANAEDKTITWTSSDSEIIKVNSSGQITAVGVGTAVITAKTSRGTSKQFTITVNEVMAQSISISASKDSILIGQDLNMGCAFEPENTTNKTVEWEVSDEKIATITSDGKITAKSDGVVVITAKHKDLVDSFELEVKPIDVENVTIILPTEYVDEGEDVVKIKIGEEMMLDADVEPNNATYKDIEWEVSDTEIATIDEDGLLKAVGTGTVTITAKAKSGVTEEIPIEVYSLTPLWILLGTTGIATSGGVAFAVKKIKKKNG